MALSIVPSIAKNIDIKRAVADLDVVGELNGGAKVTYTASELNTAEQYVSASLVDTSNSGNDFYVRIKSYSNAAVDVHVIMESVNGHGSQIKANGTYITYTSVGEQIASNKSTNGRYVTLPAKFDGIFSITSLNLADVPEWDQGESTKDVKNIKAIHFGVIAQTENIILEIGDVFTRDKNNLDASELTNTQYETHYAIKSGSSRIQMERLPVDDFVANHDLNGAALAMVQQKSDDIPAYFMFLPENMDLSNDSCIYFRIKNAWLYHFYVQFYVLSTNGHRMALGTNQVTFKYDAQGKNKTLDRSREFDSFLHIEGSFDGYIGVPYTSLIDDPHWETNQTSPTMDYSSVYALVIGLSTKYDFAAQPIFGDIFTNHATIFDGSEYTPAQFNERVKPDEYGNGQYINLSQLTGYKNETAVDFSGTTNYMTAAINGGVEVTLNRTEEDLYSSFKILADFSIPSSSPAIAMKVKNYTYDYPYIIYVKDSNGKEVTTQGQFLGNVYYIDNKGVLSPNEWGGNVVTVKIPTGFDGLMIVPFTSLCGGEYLDKENIVSIEFSMNTKYDYDFHSCFGDIGYLDSSLAYHPIITCSSISDEDWEETFVKGRNPDGINISRTQVAPKCSWIGDTKILNSLIYQDDASMDTELLTDVADNPLTYTRQDNGLVITPSEYEVGHANGPYSALVLKNNANFSDRLVMTRESDGMVAKGLTMYVKNMSSREIGVSLAFDQVTLNGGVQRWALIGYPSMYYAYDVNKDADYIFYFKRDQFQIPVGFEGYIRLPFESYGIPDWCKTNEPLDLERFSGNMYITHDNRSYGGLSYLARNVGVYFNTTTAGSMFSDGDTIKTNMGL